MVFKSGGPDIGQNVQYRCLWLLKLVNHQTYQAQVTLCLDSIQISHIDVQIYLWTFDIFNQVSIISIIYIYIVF